MGEHVNITPDLRTESWRTEQLKIFGTHFSVATHKIASLLGGGVPINEIKEWYDPNIDNDYSIDGSTSIKDTLDILQIEWWPLDQVLERYSIFLFPHLLGKGYGSKINQITEEFGRALGAKRLVIANILDDRWHKKLLKEGFFRDKNYHLMSLKTYKASVAGPGIAPGLGDYEPPVQLYTTPRLVKERCYYTSF